MRERQIKEFQSQWEKLRAKRRGVMIVMNEWRHEEAVFVIKAVNCKCKVPASHK